MKKFTFTSLVIALFMTGTYSYAESPAVMVDIAGTASTPKGISISYLEAIKKGVQVSPTANTSQARLQQQDELLTAVKAGYLPQIGAGIKTGRSVDKDNTSITPEVTVSQRLYDFGRVDSQVEQVKAETQQISALNQIELEDIAKRVSQAYILTNRFSTTLEYARSYVNAVESVASIARDRSEAGASSQSDYTQAQGRLAGAKLIANQVETDYIQNNTRLLKLLQVNDNLVLSTHQLPDDLRNFSKQKVSYESIPQYMEANAALQTAKAQIEFNKADSMPNIQLVVTANKTVEGNNPGSGEPYGSDNRIELQVAHQLYQGGASSARIRAAQSAATAAQFKLAQVVQDLDSIIATQSILIDQLGVKKQVLAERIVVLEKTRDIYQEQYKLGSRSVIDLLNIEQEIYQANVERAANEHDIWSAVADYIFVTGQAKQAFDLSLMEN